MKAPSSIVSSSLPCLSTLFFRRGGAVLLLLLFLISCGKNKSTSTRRPPSQGAPYELVVVADNNLWRSTLGDSVREVLESPVPALPQSEPHFRLFHADGNNFQRIFSGMVNVLNIKIDSTAKEPTMGVAYNVYAQPQTVVMLSAPSAERMAQLLSANRQKIIDLFVQTELNREMANLRKTHSNKVTDAVQRQFGYTAFVPTELAFIKQRPNFLWASANASSKDLNFCLYTTAESPDSAFTLERFVARRDSVMRLNIPGAQPNQWMTTAREDMFTRPVNFDGRTVQEVRGLWEMKNEAMGGPFVALTWWDSLTHRVVVAEGFVYSPGSNKRNLLRRMEAALRTVKR